MKTMAYTSSRAFIWLRAKLHTFSNWALNPQLKKRKKNKKPTKKQIHKKIEAST